MNTTTMSEQSTTTRPVKVLYTAKAHTTGGWLVNCLSVLPRKDVRQATQTKRGSARTLTGGNGDNREKTSVISVCSCLIRPGVFLGVGAAAAQKTAEPVTQK